MVSLYRPGRSAVWSLLGLFLLAGSIVACSRPDTKEALPTTPDGAHLAQNTVDTIAEARKQATLPPVPREPALDDKARAGLAVILAGLPEGVTAIDRLFAVAKLPVELNYGVGFEKDTPGLDEAGRQAGRRGGYSVSEALLAGDPALDGIGWAARGPWAVLVFRARRLGPADAPALQNAIDAAIAHQRPNLQRDAALSTLAADAVTDSEVSYDDAVGFNRAGGVPVYLDYTENDTYLPSQFLDIRLAKDGPGTLREPWLRRVGAALKITDTGTVVYVVLAAGEADQAALAHDIEAARPKATELVNHRRVELGLKKLRLDPGLDALAGRTLAEALQRQCFPGLDRCSGRFPKGTDSYYTQMSPYSSPEGAFDLAMYREDGDESFTRFGAAATIGPGGLVWSVLLLAA